MPTCLSLWPGRLLTHSMRHRMPTHIRARMSGADAGSLPRAAAGAAPSGGWGSGSDAGRRMLVPGLALLLLLLAAMAGPAAVSANVQTELISVDGSGTSNPGPFMWKVWPPHIRDALVQGGVGAGATPHASPEEGTGMGFMALRQLGTHRPAALNLLSTWICALSTGIPCYVNHALPNQQPIYKPHVGPLPRCEVERNGAERSATQCSAVKPNSLLLVVGCKCRGRLYTSSLWCLNPAEWPDLFTTSPPPNSHPAADAATMLPFPAPPPACLHDRHRPPTPTQPHRPTTHEQQFMAVVEAWAKPHHPLPPHTFAVHGGRGDAGEAAPSTAPP
eukprot:364540-Chlamydomonas_euryale.AAC.4